MQKDITILHTGLLSLLFLLPWLLSWVIFSGFAFDDAAERRQAMKFALPAEIAGNTVSSLLLICMMWEIKNPFAAIRDLAAGNCSYQDISRLTLLLVVSALLSAVYAFAAGYFYFGDWADLRIYPRKKAVLLVICTFAALPVISGFALARSGENVLEISEICRKTIVEQQDPYTGEPEEDESSYIEIRNTGTLSYEVEQLYLSTWIDELKVARLKSVCLSPGESYRLTLSSDNSMDMKKDGGTVVYLSNQRGDILDEITLPALKREEVYRKQGGKWSIVSIAKETEAPVIVAPPVFSADSGFYDSAFSLTLSAESGTQIYYTVDGSDPTPESAVYGTPISVYDRSSEPAVYRAIPNTYRDYLELVRWSSNPVPRAFVVRAVAVDQAGNRSEAVTKSYFIGQAQYETGMVISLVSDPDGLFNRETGICVTGSAYDEWYEQAYANTPEGEEIDRTDAPVGNYMLHGMEWERPANMQIFSDGESVLQQNVGIRVQGNSHRIILPRKRFSIYARKQYSGSPYFDKTFFGDYDQHSWVLREGDCYVASQRLCADRDVLTIDCLPVDVFLDGEYWYTTYLFEKFDEKNIAGKIGVYADNLILVKNGEIDSLAAQDKKHFGDALQSFPAVHDMSLPENYAAFNELVDIQSYLDMMCINMYLANLDFSESGNNLIWRADFPENDGWGDGRWRWGLLDMDLAWEGLDSSFGDIDYFQIDPFIMLPRWRVMPVMEYPIFSALMQSEAFRRQYVLTTMDLINTNFSAENVAAVLEDLKITSKSLRAFLENRTEYFLPILEEHFELSGQRETVELTSNVPAAVRLNTLSLEVTEAGWSGEYYTDYPITVTADDPAFFRWEITANGNTRTSFNRTLEIPVTEGGVEIHAIFK